MEVVLDPGSFYPPWYIPFLKVEDLPLRHLQFTPTFSLARLLIKEKKSGNTFSKIDGYLKYSINIHFNQKKNELKANLMSV
jgi:hypothetical protein